LYHHLVADRPHPLGIPTEKFLRQMEFLRQHYKLVGLGEAIDLLRRGEVKAPTVVLTFDDGYQENFINLRAVAEATSIPLTLFVCTQLAGTQQEFEHDHKRGVRQMSPLTWEQIEYLSRDGFEIGSHTRTHFDCGSIDGPALESEIAGSKADLEEHGLGPVRFFSFPWGHPANMSPPAMELARSNYPYVFSACGGANFPSQNHNNWHLRRCAHPNDLWELELTLQSVLELR
ncbi:MAG: polysaccharide deacetylase family protein, partial [Candidatus Acidiferrales bacterium]